MSNTFLNDESTPAMSSRPAAPKGARSAAHEGEAASARESRPAPRGVQRGIQSIEVGGQLLRALVHSGQPMALKDLAREAEMTPAKAHPYAVSFGRLGLIEQDAASGRYALGPLALQLGLIALHQASPVRIAAPLLADLAQRIGHTVAIAVWGARGATIVHIAESPATVHVVMRHGTVFSLSRSASGQLFGAYLPADTVRALLEQERRRAQRKSAQAPVSGSADGLKDGWPDATAGLPPTWKEFEPRLHAVRERGLSRSEGEIVPGVNALAAPVFDHAGTIVLAITAIGPAAILDTAWDGAAARALRECAAAVSHRLGAPAD